MDLGGGVHRVDRFLAVVLINFFFAFLGLHEGAVTSVQFHPTDPATILTNGMDSCIKIVDIRTPKVVHTFRDMNFQTSYAWSSASFSADGKYLTS